MLEFYFDFLDKYFSRQDFVLCYMDADSFYLVMSGDSLDEIVRPEMKEEYEADKKNWFATDKFSERTPSLFKPEFVGTRGMWLSVKCYLVQNEANWLMAFIQGRWGLDHFQNIFESIHRKIKNVM